MENYIITHIFHLTNSSTAKREEKQEEHGSYQTLHPIVCLGKYLT